MPCGCAFPAVWLSSAHALEAAAQHAAPCLAVGWQQGALATLCGGPELLQLLPSAQADLLGEAAASGDV